MPAVTVLPAGGHAGAAPGARESFEALGDAAAAVDLRQHAQTRLLWSTSAWRRRYERLSNAELRRWLQPGLAACAAAAGLPQRLACPAAAGTSVPEQTSLQLALLAPPAVVIVRIVEPEPAAAPAPDVPARALQRHLRDRERLLFTSRNVSIGEMASTLAHEINQPIGTVANVLRGIDARLPQLAAAGAALPAQVAHLQQGLKLALDQAAYAARVIGRIREYTHSRQPRREPLDLTALLRESVALLDWEFAREGVATALQVAPGGEHAWVAGDAVMLQQVVVNLLRNALDAVAGNPREQRRIEARLQCQRGGNGAGDVEVSISDNGCGISSEDESRLFVPFMSSKPDGMGLGLNICRSFIELHQGRLWFTRRPAGEAGCNFHIALPTVAG